MAHDSSLLIIGIAFGINDSDDFGLTETALCDGDLKRLDSMLGVSTDAGTAFGSTASDNRLMAIPLDSGGECDRFVFILFLSSSDRCSEILRMVALYDSH